ADLPMIFNGDMVRAILDGRKTQTRRVMKPQLGDIAHAFQFMPGQWRFIGHDGCRQHQVCRIPYASGDRLWVRESFAVSGIGWGKKPSQAIGGRVHYRADPDHGWHDYWGSWRPSIHMPRWASRLTLTVTDVRVQRVREISEADARSEGCPCQTDEELAGMEARGWFRDLWDGICAERGLGWAGNPWVCALTFTVHHCNIDKMEAC
ncbi:hypothetical protein, partial [Rhodovulum sulfidophilum]|uniref:hypothetical protein n=1 Tax=Rhodovulum sulfidophilum TaxID=35806 RepID=UPI0013893CC8